MNLKRVYDDHVNTDVTFIEFKDLCVKCWKRDKYNFILIDKASAYDDGRYRKNFDGFGLNSNSMSQDDQSSVVDQTDKMDRKVLL